MDQRGDVPRNTVFEDKEEKERKRKQKRGREEGEEGKETTYTCSAGGSSCTRGSMFSETLGCFRKHDRGRIVR